MEIRYLKLVKCIVEEGTLAAASEKLFLTPGALSQQLKEAENQLGTLIFHRVNKKMVLTEAGTIIYSTAQRILSELNKVEKEINELLYGEKGTLRLSTECYTSYHWLPSLMRKFQQLYPHVELSIVMEATHQPLQKLLSGDLDMAITSDPIDNDNIRYHELFQDEMVAVVPADHPWAQKYFVTAEDFTSENLIIHSLPLETVSVYQYLLAPAKVSPKKLTILPLTEAAIEMVKAEMGVVVMASWALKAYLSHSSLKTVKIGSEGLKRKHYLAALTSRPEATYFNHFIHFLQNELEL